MVENGIPPSPFIRQLPKRAPIEGEESRDGAKRLVLIAEGPRRGSKFSMGILEASKGNGRKVRWLKGKGKMNAAVSCGGLEQAVEANG